MRNKVSRMVNVATPAPEIVAPILGHILLDHLMLFALAVDPTGWGRVIWRVH